MARTSDAYIDLVSTDCDSPMHGISEAEYVHFSDDGGCTDLSDEELLEDVDNKEEDPPYKGPERELQVIAVLRATLQNPPSGPIRRESL